MNIQLDPSFSEDSEALPFTTSATTAYIAYIANIPPPPENHYKKEKIIFYKVSGHFLVAYQSQSSAQTWHQTLKHGYTLLHENRLYYY